MISKIYERDTPLVVVYNNLELFGPFLRRAQDPQLIQKRFYRGDRAVFWLGDPKLVVTSSKIPFPDEFCAQAGYPGTRLIAPAHPTTDLSLDVVNDPGLLNEIVAYAGVRKTLILVPYATTRAFMQLVNTLRSVYGLTIKLPESPAEENLWVRDFVDTKTGFRALASACLSNPGKCLPEGFHCSNRRQAADGAGWFMRRDKACVVKADHGESGLGHQIIEPGQFASLEDIYEHLAGNPFLEHDLIIVEELIRSTRNKSPSLELFVPAAGGGDPHITYLSEQLFDGFGNFSGVLIAMQSQREAWYGQLAEYGLLLARHLQKMGYQGHFDLDAVVDDRDQVWLLEINSRRTGGTFVHEYARYMLGDDYLEKYVLLSHNKIPCNDCYSYGDLIARVGEFNFPMQSGPRGIVISVVSALAVAEFGCIVIDRSVEAVKALYNQVIEPQAAEPI